jgi:CRISPR-associated endoribonuclease Cas6
VVWRTFGAPHVADVTLDLGLDPLVVTSVSGTTQVERVVLHERPNGNGVKRPVEVTVGGFVGRVRYGWAAVAEDQLPAVHALARLATFSGVGAWTTRGFGGTRPRDG